MATVQETIDNLISYIDAAVAKHSVSNRHVATVLAFLNEGLKSLSSKYLSKTEADTAGGFITFMKGLLSHGDVTVKGNSSVDGTQYVGGVQTLGSGFQTEGFRSVAGRTYGAQLTKSGILTVAGVVAMSFEIFELVYNKIRAQGGRATFSDTATIESCLYAMDAEENETVTPEEFYERNRGVSGDAWVAAVESIDHVIIVFKKEEHNSNSVPFENADLIYGYVNSIGESGQYARGGMCSMTIITEDEYINADGSMVVRAVLSPIGDPTENPEYVVANMPPTEGMVVAQNGNANGGAADGSKRNRTTSFFIDSEAGHIIMLQNVTTPTITDANYAVISGLLPADLLAKVRKEYSFVDEYTPVSYAKYGIFENFLQFDHQGAPIKTERFRDAWSAAEAVDNPYRSSGTKDVTYYDTTTHQGSKWKCIVDRTLEEPGTGNDWLQLVAKGDKGDQGVVANANLLMNSNFDLFLPDAWSTISAITKEYAIFSESYGEKWVSLTRQATANQAALVRLVNGVYTPRYDTFTYDDDGIYWCFVGTPDDFVIYNKLTGPTKALTASSIASGTMLTMVDAGSAIHWYMSMVPNSDKTMYVATKSDNALGINAFGGSSSGGNLGLYRVQGDSGSQWLFTSIDKKLALWSEQNGVVWPAAMDGFNTFICYTGWSLEMATPVLQPNRWYTFSFYYRVHQPNTSKNDISWTPYYFFDDDDISTNGKKYGYSTVGKTDFYFGGTVGEWKKAYVKFRHAETLPKSITFEFFNNTTSQVCVSQLKLEEGDTATSYQKHESDFMLPVKSTVFKRGASKPAAPTGGSYERLVPEGWSDGIPEGEGAVYSSTCTFYAGGYDTGWSDVQLLADSGDFDVCYCLKETYTLQPPATHPNGENTDWQNSPSESAIWMATCKKDVGGSWGAWTISRIKGENGADGLTPNPNLLRNTNFDVYEQGGQKLAHWTTQDGSVNVNDVMLEGFNTFAPYYILGATMPTLEIGKTYTFSFAYRCAGTLYSITWEPDVDFGGILVMTSDNCRYNASDNKFTLDFTGDKWQVASITFRPTSADNVTIGFLFRHGSNKWWYLSKLKLEEGDTVTAYQKHPDDLNGLSPEPNLIPNSDFSEKSGSKPKGWEGIKNGTIISSALSGYNALQLYKLSGTGSYHSVIPHQTLTSGNRYTFSAWVKSDAYNYVKIALFFANDSYSVRADKGTITANGTVCYVEIPLTVGEFEYITVTFSGTFPSDNKIIRIYHDTSPYICRPKLEGGAVATPYRKAEADLVGPAGEAGEAVFPLGDWMADVRYTRTENSTISVHYLEDDKYYKLKVSFPEDTTGILPTDGEYWEYITAVKAIYAEFLMANFALFGSKRGGVFYDRYLFSQWGIDRNNAEAYFSAHRDGTGYPMFDKTGTDEDPTYLLNGNFQPHLFLDFLRGMIKTNKLSETFKEFEYISKTIANEVADGEEYTENPEEGSMLLTPCCVLDTESGYNVSIEPNIDVRWAEASETGANRVYGIRGSGLLLSMPLVNDIKDGSTILESKAPWEPDGMKVTILVRENDYWNKCVQHAEGVLYNNATVRSEYIARDCLERGVVLCADARVLNQKSYKGKTYSGVTTITFNPSNYNTNGESLDTAKYGGFFVVKGRICKFLFVEPGMMVRLRSCTCSLSITGSSSGTNKLPLWYVDNSDDFAEVDAKVVFQGHYYYQNGAMNKFPEFDGFDDDNNEVTITHYTSGYGYSNAGTGGTGFAFKNYAFATKGLADVYAVAKDYSTKNGEAVLDKVYIRTRDDRFAGTIEADICMVSTSNKLNEFGSADSFEQQI